MENKKKKSGIRLTIGNKILGGFLAIVVLFIINATIIFLTGNNIDTVVKNSSENIRPSKEAIGEFQLLVEKSKMYATNWVYLPTYEVDKKALIDIHNQDYPQLKERIVKLKKLWESDSQKLKIDTVFKKFEDLIQIQKNDIIQQLVSFESYEDPLTKLLAEDVVETKIIPITTEITILLDEIAEVQTDATIKSDQGLINSSSLLKNITIILSIVIIILAILSALLLVRAITTPVNFLKNIVVKLGNGELVEEKQAKFSNDEIGDMAVAMDNLVNGLKATTLFAENIGNGTYDSAFKPLSDHDVLGNALIDMRNNLAKVAEDDKRRNWATEGLARFGELLRTNNDNLDKLADEIIGNLVKYLKANQGAIYIIDDSESGDEPTMSMKACYAWDKKKFLNHQIHRGEGLAGQAWQEGDIIYLTEVPSNYIKITSGLGDANPTSVIIVPLKVNDEIFGIVEIASFNVFKDYETEFVQKIAESIASTISSVKINARTQRLLEESQEMTEQMRAQEEEMRQNMEELQATQEEMQRSQSETESTMLAINGSMGVAEYDAEGRITKINSMYLNMIGFEQAEVVGEHHRIFVPKEEKSSEEYRQFWRDLTLGNPKKGVFTRINRKGEAITLRSSFSPIKNRTGEVVKIMEIVYTV